jgi:hypothetical protein
MTVLLDFTRCSPSCSSYIRRTFVRLSCTYNQLTHSHQHEGLQINQNEALASYFSRLFPSNLDVQVTHCTDDNNHYPNSSIMVQDSTGHFEMSFRQTLRVPDDGKVHKLPPSLGPFPLFNVENYRHKLSPELTMTGGLFLPMYRTYSCHR